MELPAFAGRSERYCRDYLQAVHNALASGALLRGPDGSPNQPSYPTMLIVFETPTHFAAELVGSAPTFEAGLKVVHRKLPTLQSFLGHFPAEDSFSGVRFAEEGGSNHILNMTFMSARGFGMFQARYPELGDLNGSSLVSMGPLSETQAFQSFEIPVSFQDLWLNNVLTVNDWHGQVRARYFQTSWIIERSASSSELNRRFEDFHPRRGELTLLAPSAGAGRRPLTTAANFSSLAAVDKVGETTITTFLERNEDVLLTALGAQRLIPQPLLPWLSGDPDPDETAIQPDFLFVDRSGALHVCEVKLPLLNKRSLTTGGRRRRRFVSDVADGIAQLFNYLAYLGEDAHQRLLRERYDAAVNEPRLVLLVGSAENFDVGEVDQAMRMHKMFELLDYDTVRALYLAGSGYVPGIR